MGGGKSTVPEDIRGTLALSNPDSIHILTFIIILYMLYIIAISKYPKPSYLKKYICVNTIKPNL